MTEYNDDLLTSKTQQKRDDSALQELGLSLMDMKPAERERLPLGDELKKALDEAGRINHHEARRRHAQYIGRLMRESNSEQIIQALECLLLRTDTGSQLVKNVPKGAADGFLNRGLRGFPLVQRNQSARQIRVVFYNVIRQCDTPARLFRNQPAQGLR